MFFFILFATTEIIVWSANMLLKVISVFLMKRNFYGSDECDFFGHCNIESNYIH